MPSTSRRARATASAPHAEGIVRSPRVLSAGSERNAICGAASTNVNAARMAIAAAMRAGKPRDVSACCSVSSISSCHCESHLVLHADRPGRWKNNSCSGATT